MPKQFDNFSYESNSLETEIMQICRELLEIDLEPPVNIFYGGFYSFETSVQQQQGRLFTAQKHKMSSSQRLFSSPMPDHAEKGH